jgi:hypothetical protein
VTSDSLVSSATSTWTQISDYDYNSHAFQYTVDASSLGLVAGQLYRFRFRAVNFYGNSPYSDTVRIGLGPLPVAPTAPQRLQDSADGTE